MNDTVITLLALAGSATLVACCLYFIPIIMDRLSRPKDDA